MGFRDFALVPDLGWEDLGGCPEPSHAPSEADSSFAETWSAKFDVDLDLPLEAALPRRNGWKLASFDLDLENVAGFESTGGPDPESHELDMALWLATGDLRPSNISRLTRVVRDWTEVEEQAATHFITPLAELEPESCTGLFGLMHEAQHRLLQREKGKEVWSWFRDLRDAALAIAEDGTKLDGHLLLKILRLRRAAVPRRVRRHRPTRRRSARAERLIRLAHHIAPNAPPARLETEPMPTGAA